MPITPWTAAILHVPTNSIAAASDRAEALRMRMAKLDELDARIGAALEEKPCDLVMLPEFPVAHCETNLYGVSEGDGPEVDRLSEIAQKYGVFFCAMLYVTDKRFPGRYFNASMLFDERGTLLARYYRLITNHSISPHDFWQRYLDVVGIDGAFPVVDTRLGKLAMMSSMEIMYPEIARVYMLRGAETLLHLTAYSTEDMGYMNRARARENMMYFLSANAIDSSPNAALQALSAVDWRGRLIGEGGASDTHLCHATIDVEDLRTGRSTPLHDDYVNLISRLRTEVMRGHYDDLTLFPVDEYVEGRVHDVKVTPEDYPDGIDRAIANMRRAGILPAA
jgi:predicted amidohydrolase